MKRSYKTVQERIEEYKSWCISHDRLPSRKSDNKEERSLADWYNGYRKRGKERSLIEELTGFREKYLETEKCLRRRNTEETVISDLRNFIESYGRFPKRYNCNKKESSLYERIYKKLRRKPGYDSLNLLVKKYELSLGYKFISREPCRKRGEERLEDFEFWCQVNQQSPSSSYKTKEEKDLYNWQLRYRKRYPNSPVTKKILEIINKFSKLKPSEETFLEFIKYTLTNNSLPSIHQHSLYKWYYRVRNMYPGVQNFVDVFNLHLHGDQKATFIIDKLKEKYITRD